MKRKTGKEQPIERSVSESPPDHALRPVVESSREGAPEIYQIVKRGAAPDDKRTFLKQVSALGGLALLNSILNSCGKSSFNLDPTDSSPPPDDQKPIDAYRETQSPDTLDHVQEDVKPPVNETAKANPDSTKPPKPPKPCSCENVCACDTENGGVGDQPRRYDRWSGGVCTCNSVCTCNLVCTCDTVCTCQSVCSCESVGGSHYWYPN